MYSCFNISRCLSNQKVYVYPDDPELHQSEVYKKILKVFVFENEITCLYCDLITVDSREWILHK